MSLTLRRKRFANYLLLVVAAAGVCASGCTRPAEQSKVTLRIGLGVPPKTSRGSGAGYVSTSLGMEPWLTSRADGRQTERVATSWAWDDSGTVLTLKLRPDVYFHDGTKLTPELAAEILRRSVKEQEALSFAAITSVQPRAPDLVEITLKEPNAFLLPDLSLATVRLSGEKEIGAGPFTVVRTEGQKTILAAFPKYYRGKPSIDEIEISQYPTQRNAWSALMRGEVDMLHEVSRDAVEFVEAETTVKAYSFPRPYYITLGFNVRHPALARPEVRIAINEALDKATLVQVGLNKRGRPAEGPIWPEHWAHSTPTQPFIYNPASANARLDRLGLTVKQKPDGSMPSRFTISCLVWDDPRFERLAVLVQRQLADIGIDMRMIPVNQVELVRRLAAGDFDTFLFEMFGRSLSWLDVFWRSHPGTAPVDSGYQAANAVLDRMRTARSDDDVRATVAEFEQILHDNPPAVFIAWQETSRAVSTRFEISPEKDRDILTNIWQWRPRDY